MAYICPWTTSYVRFERMVQDAWGDLSLTNIKALKLVNLTKTKKEKSIVLPNLKLEVTFHLIKWEPRNQNKQDFYGQILQRKPNKEIQ